MVPVMDNLSTSKAFTETSNSKATTLNTEVSRATTSTGKLATEMFMARASTIRDTVCIF